MSRILKAWCYVIALLAVSASPGQAQTYDWSNSSGGTYGTGSNWTPVGPPGAGATARFALANTYNVTFSGSATANILTMSQGNVTFFLNGFTYQPTNTVNNGMGASGFTSTLRITNGTFLPGNFSVGGNPGSTSTLILDAGSTTNVGAGVFFVGSSGTGSVSVQNGADLTTSASTGVGINASGNGTVTVTGAGSTWMVNNTLRIGASGTGTLNIQNGGAVTASALEVGENFNSVGTVSLSGAGASFTTNGTANIGGSFASFPAASATVTVGPGATMSLNSATNLRTSAILNVNGGVLNLSALTMTPGAAVNWSAGHVSFADGATITDAVLDLLLAGTHTLATNHTLSASGGTMNLDSSLAVHGGTLNVANLDINAPLSVGPFGTVSAADTMMLGSGQSVELENYGTLGAGNLIHNAGGQLLLMGANAKVTGFFANNFGTVEGTGRFAAGMNNGTGGTIRAGAGEHLIIEEFGLTNPGIIELAGGTVEYTHTLSNLGNGFIIGRGTFRGGSSAPGSSGLSNIGVVGFSGGTTDVFGDVLNAAGGRIVVSGASTVTFYDDVTHNGLEIRTNVGSRIVFFGSVSGAGPFTGPGTVEINGDLKPGNSPGTFAFSGDLDLSPSAVLVSEIGGTAPGTGHDRVEVSGVLSLHGTLAIAPYSGFTPSLGQSFQVLRFGSRSGTFENVTGMGIGAGKVFQVQYHSNDVTLVVASAAPFDFDADGDVDDDDRSVFEACGSGPAIPHDGTVFCQQADIDDDNDVDSADFGVFERCVSGADRPYDPGCLN